MASVKSFLKKVRRKGIKFFFAEAIPWHTYNLLENLNSKIIKSIFSNKPLEDVIIIESHNDFDSNGGAFYDYLIENGYNKKYKIVWFLRNNCPKKLPDNVEGYRYNKLSIKRVYYHCVAKYILCEHYTIPAIREGQISIFMRHGAGGLKKITNHIRLPKGIHYVMGLSEKYAPIENLASLCEHDSTQILYLGFPSHDYLFKNNSSEIKKITEDSFRKVILWMPTFRKNVGGRNDSSIELPLGIPLFENLEEYESLNTILRDMDCLLLIKIHPMQDISTIKIQSMSNIRVMTGEDVKRLGVDNYKLMPCCDAMISDYSGAAYDYIQLNRPMAYVLSDMNEYKIGFVVEDIHELIAGKEIYTLNDLIDFIGSVVNDMDEFKEKRESLREYFHTYHDGNNSKRLAEFLEI